MARPCNLTAGLPPLLSACRVWRYAHRLAADARINDTTCLITRGSDCQITTKTLQQSGRLNTVFTLVAAVYFPGRRVYEDVSFECHHHSSSVLLSRLTLTTSPPSTFMSWRRFCWRRLVLERHFSKPRRSTRKKRQQKQLGGLQDCGAAGGTLKRQITKYH